MAIYRLPDGTITRNKTVYIRSWRKIGKVIGKATNSLCFAFDPGLSFQSKDKPSFSWNINGHVACKLAKALTGVK